MWWRLFNRARVVIRTESDGRRTVRASGRLGGQAARIAEFVRAEAIPDGSITLTLGWRYRFGGALRAHEQQIRNWLGATCHLLPPGRAGGRGA
jgi:hypothetical protein